MTTAVQEMQDIPYLFAADAEVNDQLLQVLALTPTRHLGKIAAPGLIENLSDAQVMRIAVFLSKKGYDEGGCAIGGVVRCNETGRLLGKGHNRHVQENRVYWHGETDAIQDAGTRVDFSQTTLFTTLTPCSVCAAMTFSQSFARLVIGNRLDGANAENEALLRSKGVTVDIQEDPLGQRLYAEYAAEKPEQDTRDWQGEAGVQRLAAGG